MFIPNWTLHVIRRFLERYEECGIRPMDFFAITDRIERKHRLTFENILRATGLRPRYTLMIVPTYGLALDRMVKINLIYCVQDRKRSGPSCPASLISGADESCS